MINNMMKLVAGAVFAAMLPAGQSPEPIVLGRQTAAQARELARGGMLPGATIKVPAGVELPIDVAMRGDLAITVEPVTPVKLKARRDLWIRFTGDSVVLSLDGVHFRPITEVITGSVSFALKADEDGSNLKGELSTEIRLKRGDM